MRMVDLITKKRNGGELTSEEIRWIVEGYTKAAIPDYQMASFMMAVYFQGMNSRETADLTMAMAHSGDRLDLRSIRGMKVDKHSTGGVGDKTTLIVGPLVASAGVPVAKMSGRGLGHTGGTIDKLEAIPGFRTDLSTEQFIDNVNRCQLAIAGQTGNLAPADKKMYSIRDVTATVDAIPLIAGSIMSKKIASGADAIVLDVKAGSGAFMKTREEARQLASLMVDIGEHLHIKTSAVISDMSEPLGYEVGNANEVKEAIDVLKGDGERALTNLCLDLASRMAVAGEAYSDVDTARGALEMKLQSGEALASFKRFVKAQGGAPDIVDDPELLPQAEHRIEVKTDETGRIETIDAESVGLAAMLLGAGRLTKDDVIDHAAGITLRRKVGDHVKEGEVIAVLHSNQKEVSESVHKLKNGFGVNPL